MFRIQCCFNETSSMFDKQNMWEEKGKNTTAEKLIFSIYDLYINK